MANVADDDERLGLVEAARVAERLAVGLFHQDVPCRRSPLRLAQPAGAFARRLLGLQNEAPLLVEVDAADRRLAAFMGQRGRALEDIGVFGGVALRRVGPRHAKHVAQFRQEEILVCPLRRAGRGPLRDENIKGLSHAGQHRNLSEPLTYVAEQGAGGGSGIQNFPLRRCHFRGT